ncbi:Uma2 family endonuclease [Streptomyces varsoviensis]|uniref:Putative restriction endonuclease domain-containing protein n=1 Tax=Streptomyces varsoviensis TaxID=67373 RepID=A0ABR5IZR6_9ACTN|nr:Uma2 family endonuclease [Streptomyces varsoviensis]KOG86623.1 hypothetical protein ADK38_29995 [Streptomyces varsoviensis]
MTPSTAKQPQMAVEDFEQIAHEAPETVTLEFIDGKLEVKPVPDGDHDEIIMWLLEQCMQQQPALRLYPERGLRVETYRKGRARPDGVLAPRRHFAGQGEWAEPDGILMTVEVTSYDADTDNRDRHEKRFAYGDAGIPVYLLIDRDAHTLAVYSELKNGNYKKRLTYDYGDTVELPAPVSITLDTEELKDYVR